MDLVFLGINDAGWDIYEWLCERDDVNVVALLTTKEQLDLIEKLEPDIVVCVGYQHILPENIISIPDLGCLNVHPGYLPQTRGFNPNVWSIIDGLPAGATIHYIDADIDTGDIIARQRVKQSFGDTGKSLYNRVEKACVELFIETWPDIISGDVETVSQTDHKATYHYKSEFEEVCKIDPQETYKAKELLDILRALTFPPFNNTFIEIDGEKYYIEIDITSADETDRVDRVGTLSSY